MSRFDEPLTKALDPKTAKLLHSVLGLETVGDLLRHYPRRYAERGELTSLDALEVDEHVTVVGEVTRLMRKPMRNRGGTWLEVEVVDGSGNKIYLSFFGKGSHVAETRLKPGRRGMFAGKVGVFGSGHKPRWQLSHPEFELFEEGEAGAEEFAAAPVPIYPAGKDLTPVGDPAGRSASCSTRWARWTIRCPPSCGSGTGFRSWARRWWPSTGRRTSATCSGRASG